MQLYEQSGVASTRQATPSTMIWTTNASKATLLMTALLDTIDPVRGTQSTFLLISDWAGLQHMSKESRQRIGHDLSAQYT